MAYSVGQAVIVVVVAVIVIVVGSSSIAHVKNSLLPSSILACVAAVDALFDPFRFRNRCCGGG